MAPHQSEDVINLAGLSLITRQSGISTGRYRISRSGRPLWRAMAYMLAVRNIPEGGIFHAEYQGVLSRDKEGAGRWWWPSPARR